MNVRQRVPSSVEQLAEHVNHPAPAIVVEQPRILPLVEAKAYPPKIAKALIAITRALSPVRKSGVNEFHKYAYPKWEDVLDEIGPKIAEQGLIIQQSETAHAGLESDMIAITYEFTIINEDGDVWPDRPIFTAICKIRDAKGVLDDKASSKCCTQAEKYFNMKLFKIRTRDMDQDDHDYDPNKHKNARKRQVPTSSGKLRPHLIETLEGDTAASWAKRFIDLANKSDTTDELSAWDKLNDELIERLKAKAPDTYNKVVEALDAKGAALAPKAAEAAKEDAIVAKIIDDFPGDKPMKPAANADGLDIPANLRRKPKPVITEDERDWLHGLSGAFSGCEDLKSLSAQVTKLMLRHQDKVSDAAWNEACDLNNQHIARIQGED